MKYYLYDQQGEIITDITTDHKLQRGVAVLVVNDGVYMVVADLVIPSEPRVPDTHNLVVNKVSRPVSFTHMYERPTGREPLTLKSTQAFTQQ